MNTNVRVCGAAFAPLALLSACISANQSSIYRSFDAGKLDNLSGVLIDAKQRAIISKRRPILYSDGAPWTDSEGRPVEGPTVVCAEPSPDVFTAISQSFGSSGSFSGTSKEAQLALSYALAESAGELRRARTIQLLRDSLFNTCLGYMNGSLSGSEYQKLLNKYADETLTLLAVEQITPQAVTTPLTLTAEGIGGGSTKISNQSPPPAGAGKGKMAGAATADEGGTGSDQEPAAQDQAKPTDIHASDPAGAAKAKTDTKPSAAAATTRNASGDTKLATAKAPQAKPANQGDQTPGSSGTSDTSKNPITAAYPSGNIQTLAPPTNAAVDAVKDMVHTFLLDTLVNKCLDSWTEEEAKSQTSPNAPAVKVAPTPGTLLFCRPT